jgi:efflux transporter, RND family, MFP subunit
MLKNKKRFAIIAILVAIAGISFVKFTSSNSNTTVSAASIETKEVVKTNMLLKYDVDGTVESEKEVLVFPTVPGKVKRVYYRLGDEVEKGAILLDMDSSSIEDININIDKASLSVSQRKKELSDLQSLYSVGGASKSEIEQARNALRLAELDLKSAKNSSSGLSSSVVSPVSGVITESNADDNLKVDQSKQLFKIVDVENLKVSAEIPNSKVKNIKVGSKVIIKSDSLPDGTKIEATVSDISKISTLSTKFNDSVTKTNIKLEKNSGLKPGEKVKLSIIYDELNDVITVPLLYVEIDAVTNKSYVYVLGKNNIVEKREVVVGKTDNINYEIKSGLEVGDKLLNNISKQFKEGDKLK